MIGDLVTGRVAEATGQAFNVPLDDTDGAGGFQFLAEVLRWRAQTQPDNLLYTVVDNKVCWGLIAPGRQQSVLGVTV